MACLNSAYCLGLEHVGRSQLNYQSGCSCVFDVGCPGEGTGLIMQAAYSSSWMYGLSGEQLGEREIGQ